MFGFRKISPDFIAVPVESSVAQQLAELRSRHDAALRLIDSFAAGRDPDVRDAVLEVRIALMPPPAVPVVAGPDRFDEYWENPR